jgi:hypothetical protein
MEGKASTYTGSEKLSPTDGPEEKTSRRKRYSPLSDAQLTDRRDQLVQFLESAWGPIGWDLRSARKPADVERAIASTGFENTGYRDLLLPFARAVTCKTDLPRMRVLRRKIRKLNNECYEAFQAKQPANDALQQAQLALTNCSEANLKRLKLECTKRHRQANNINERYAALDQERNILAAELQQLEAAFAQSELLKIVRSSRYSYTPLHLANGLAGVPYIGWRHSVTRCSQNPCQVANGYWYSIFKLIERATTRAETKSAAAVLLLTKNSVLDIKDKQHYVRDSLAENWHFLKRAIEEVSKARHHHPKALPFRITAAFQEKMRSVSAEERVIADIEKLILKART